MLSHDPANGDLPKLRVTFWTMKVVAPFLDEVTDGEKAELAGILKASGMASQP